MRSAVFIATAMLLALNAPASAQISRPATAADFNAICSGVLAQSAGGVSGEHTKLCTCLSNETLARLTQAEMLAYAEATAGNKAAPDAVMAKILGIATYCLGQAQ